MWYRISFNPDTDVMGCDTQVKKLHNIALDFQDKLWDVTYLQSLKFEETIDYVELKTKAKFTDILWDYSLQGRAMFISEKVKVILADYKLLNTDFYPSIVKRGNHFRRYYCMRLTGDIANSVNYVSSEFMWYKSNEGKDYPLVFANAVEMLNKKREVGPIDSIRATKLYFKDDFIAQKFDLIFLGALSVGNYWTSERLKKRLDDDGVTGFKFIESGFIINGGD